MLLILYSPAGRRGWFHPRMNQDEREEQTCEHHCIACGKRLCYFSSRFGPRVPFEPQYKHAAATVADHTGHLPALQQSNAGNNTGGMASVPSLENRPMASRARASTSANFQLPKDDGQYWVEYDLKPYTRNLTKVEQPQQAIIDWILRETGTDVWFSQPMGVLNADRDTLRVYHNQAMQKTVSEIYERFVNGSTDPQVFGMRLITINNPNWRTRAAGWMKSVQVQSPGVHAWLLSKENTALLLAMLRGRSDYREVQAGDITINNGQTQTLEQLRSRNYVREYRRTEQGWPPYVPDSAEIQEGYRLQMSPLLSIDHRMVDVRSSAISIKSNGSIPSTSNCPYRPVRYNPLKFKCLKLSRGDCTSGFDGRPIKFCCSPAVSSQLPAGRSITRFSVKVQERSD